MPLFLLAKWKWILRAASAAFIAWSTWWVTSSVYKGKIAALELSQERARNEAFLEGQRLQRLADDAAIEVTDQVAKANEKIVTVYRTIEKEVSIYVKDDSTCITYGLVRVHDAGAYGIGTGSLDLPPGVTDETCAPVGWRTLAATFTGNYEASTLNAAQLTGLQDYLRRLSSERASAPPIP